MRRYFRIYRAFVVSAIARELQFRANFFAKVLQNAMWIGFYAVLIFVVYSKTNSVAGWSEGDSFVLSGTVVLLEVLGRALLGALILIPEQVRKGTLDYVVTRPIDSQFWVSLLRFDIGQIGPFVGGLVMVIAGIHGHVPSPDHWLAWLLQFGFAAIIFYSFQLFLMTTSIWLVRVDNLFILAETATGVARNPLQIYPTRVQQFLIYFLPIGLLGTIPAQALIHEYSLAGLITAGCWAVGSFIGSRLFWKYAATAYSSASS